MRTLLATLIMTLLLLATSVALAEVPTSINYQGYLTDDQGDPVTLIVTMTFTIYDDPTGGNPKWTETQTGIQVANGLFSVILGTVTPIDDRVFVDPDRYLGVAIAGDPEIIPRTRLLTVPYAYHALSADSAKSGGGWVDDGSVVRLGTESDFVGIGTSSPTNMVHIKGSDSQPLLYVEKTGSGRGLKVSTTSACAIWVENSGNHGLRVTSANGDGVHVTSANGWAGYFGGDVNVVGNLSKGAGSFRIDHPLDPENKYLYHSFVESPDMMNVYNGNTILDQSGSSEILLPDYFAALNMDFRYQLTAIGAPAPNLYVARRIVGNRFSIAGGTPGGEVSWQVTGIRKDPYAEANRIQVEVDKQGDELGKYVHPEVLGLGEEFKVGYEERNRIVEEDEMIRRQLHDDK